MDTNVTIVTLSEDRFFLYNNTFKKLISWNDFIKNKSYKNVIDLSFYSPWHTRFEKIDFFKQVNYSFDMFEKTDKFINYINDIQYCNLENYSFTNDIYYMLCVRFKTDNDKLNKLINKIHKIHENTNDLNKGTECNIVVYAVDLPKISEPNVHIIKNLQTYASLLNNNNCKLVIS